MKSSFTIFLLIFLNASLFALSTGKINFVLDQGFVKNVGQIKDQYGRTNNSALYLFETPKLSVQLRQNGFSYELKKDISENESKTAIHRVDIDFVNAHAHIEDSFGEENKSKLILISKQDANTASHLTQYSKVVFRNIYPETDLEFLVIPVNGEPRFKYNIILRPGADISRVKLLITGANEVKLLNSGAIEMKTALGSLEEQVPLSYELNQGGQQGKKITARFKQLGANIFGLNVPRYNSSKILVIDPMIWSTYFGGTSIEQSGGIVVDKDSNVFISGRTASLTNIATVGANQSSLAGGNGFDGFLAKFSPTGALLWATYYGGTGADELQKLALDKDQNIFVTGGSGSSSGIATAGAYQTTNNGTSNGILAKFSQAGNLIWATYFGGTSANPFYDIDIDVFDNITIIGTSSSTTSLNFPNTHQTSVAGLTDVIIAKFNSAGQIKWATYYGGTLNDNALGICSDNNANIYITGNTFSSGGFSTPGAYQVNSAGGSEVYIAKFDSLGKLVYGTFYGGAAADVGYDIALDAEGKLVIGGITSSTAGIATPGAFQTSITGSAYDAFILRMDTSGAIIWCTYFGGTGTDNLYNLALDAASNIYFSGGTGSVGLATAGSFQSTMNATYDALFAKFNKNGALEWASYFGGSSSSENIERIFLDKAGYLYALGVTSSDNNIATPGAYQTVKNGSSQESFVFKFFVGVPVVEGPITNNTLPANQGLCIGSTASKIIGSSPQGGNGTYVYEWLYSSTGAAGTFGIANGVRNGIDYDPIGITANGYFKRVVTSGLYKDTSATHSITFGTALNAGFTVNKGIQCLNSNVFVFSDTTTSAGPITYYWDFGNGTYGSKQVEQVTFAANKENLYKVSLITSLNGACGDTNYATVYTITNPVLKTINGKDTVLKGTTEIYNVIGTVGSSYNWLFSNGNGRSYTNTLNIKWTQLGDVQLKMVETNSGSCAGDTAIKNIYVKQPTGNEEWFNDALQIYPNPSEGLIYIDTYEQTKIQVRLFDITGKLLFKTEQNSQAPIAIDHLPAGLYLLELTDENGLCLHKKIQKQ
jgi:hypothetical protein